jgi:hypothetical protein
LVELGISARIVARWSLKKHGVRMWTGFNQVRIGSCGGGDDESSVSIEGRKFLDQLSDSQLFKIDSALWD